MIGGARPTRVVIFEQRSAEEGYPTSRVQFAQHADRFGPDADVAGAGSEGFEF